MNRSDAVAIQGHLDTSIQRLENCKCCIGPTADESNCEWMKDVVLSELIRVEDAIKNIRILYGVRLCTFPNCKGCDHILCDSDYSLICGNSHCRFYGCNVYDLKEPESAIE